MNKINIVICALLFVELLWRFFLSVTPKKKKHPVLSPIKHVNLMFGLQVIYFQAIKSDIDT